MAKSTTKESNDSSTTTNPSPNRQDNSPAVTAAAAGAAANDDINEATTTTINNNEAATTPPPPRLPAPEFGPGWTVQTFSRKPTENSSRSPYTPRFDKYWYAPEEDNATAADDGDGSRGGQQKFRSVKEVERYLARQKKKKRKQDEEGDEDNNGGDADDTNNSDVPPILQTPVRNIRMKVNVNSKEIVSVEGDPVAVADGLRSSSKKKKGKKGGKKEDEQEEGDDNNDDSSSNTKFSKAGDAKDDLNVEAAQNDNAAAAAAAADDDTNENKKKKKKVAGTAVLDYFGANPIARVRQAQLESANKHQSGSDDDKAASYIDKKSKGDNDNDAKTKTKTNTAKDGITKSSDDDDKAITAKLLAKSRKKRMQELFGDDSDDDDDLDGIMNDDNDDDGDDDPGAKNDSSYSESPMDDGKESDDDLIVDDDTTTNTDTTNNNSSNSNKKLIPQTKPTSQKSGTALINSHAQITSGPHKGTRGQITSVKQGWYTLKVMEGEMCKARRREFRVVGEEEEEGGEEKDEDDEDEVEEDGKEEGEEEEDATSSSSTNPSCLMGATVRVKSGPFTNLIGIINEKKSYRHVQLDSMGGLVTLANVQIITSSNSGNKKKQKKELGSSSSTTTTTANQREEEFTSLSPLQQEALIRKYMGAHVKVLEPEEHAGLEGKVTKVVVGDWYITDNPNITNAYQAKKFDVLKKGNAASAAAAVAAAVAAASAAAAADAYAKEKKEKEAENKGGEKKSNDDENDVASGGGGENGSGQGAAKGAKEEEEGKEGGQEDEKVSSTDLNDVVVSGKDAGNDTKSDGEVQDAQMDEEVEEKQNDGNDSAKEAAPASALAVDSSSTGVARAATSNQGEAKTEGDSKDDDDEPPTRPSSSNRDDRETTTGQYNSEDEEENKPNLLGATTRIKHGRYKGLEGVINEKQSIRRLQLDTIPGLPLSFDDVTVIEYAHNAHACKSSDDSRADDFARKYQKYMGARVRVLRPSEFAGREGIVIRVFIFGDWYITDNPGIPMAFPEHKFDVVKYPPGYEKPPGDEKMEDGDDVDDVGNGGGSFGDEEDDDDNDRRGRDRGEEDENMGEGNAEQREYIDFPIDADLGGNGAIHCIPGSPPPSNNQIIMDENYGGTKEKAGLDSDTPLVDEVKDGKKDKDEKKDRAKDQNNQIGKEDAKEASSSSRQEKQDDTIAESELSAKGKEGEETSGDDEAQDLKPAANPFIGATVRVTSGTFQGHGGKLTMTESRGWWTIDNPNITKKINSTNCKIVDDGKVDLGAIREWYESRGLLRRMPPIIQPGQKKHDNERKKREAEEATSLQESVSGEMDIENDFHGPFKRKMAETDFTGDGNPKRTKKLGVIERGPDLNLGATAAAFPEPQEKGSQKRKRPRRADTAPGLNPISLQPTGEPIAKKKEQLKIQLLPVGLRHLSPDTKIEIFNRRTAKIMRGDDAVLLSDLAAALMDHAEYEPIVPPPPGNSGVTSRIGRSGPKVRVNSNITPQSRVRGSSVEGKNVLVNGGEHRGLTGKIDAVFPGGWYLVSGLFKHGSDTVVVSMDHLQVIPEKITFTNSLSSETQGVNKIRIHLKAAKLRLEAFAEERSRLQKDSSGGRALAQLKELDAVVGKTSNLIADLQQALDRMMNQPSG